MRDIIAYSTVETLLEILLLILINMVQKKQFLRMWIFWKIYPGNLALSGLIRRFLWKTWQSFLVRIIGKVTEKRVSLDYLSSKTMHSYN